MTKSFITHKHHKTTKKNEHNKTTHNTLEKFYPEEQKEKEKIASIEDQIFEHLKKHTRKILDKKKD